jgi:oligopeptide/dipeptide ABC transporter ATP-binding protein
MRRVPLLLAPAILVLAACGAGAADTAATSAASDATSAAPSTSEAAPSPTAALSTTAPAPAGELFVDVVDQALEPYAALIGTSLSSADPASALPLFDGDVPLPAGNVVGAGRLVEQAPVLDLFSRPLHPYTIALFQSLPAAHAEGERLKVIRGQVPSAFSYPSGCRFCARCDRAVERCGQEYPPFAEKAPGHWAACWQAPSQPGTGNA